MANEVKETKAEKPKKAYEAVYSLKELVNASVELGANRIVVRAALSKAGKKAYTMKEARQLVEKFKKTEVKA